MWTIASTFPAGLHDLLWGYLYLLPFFTFLTRELSGLDQTDLNETWMSDQLKFPKFNGDNHFAVKSTVVL